LPFQNIKNTLENESNELNSNLQKIFNDLRFWDLCDEKLFLKASEILILIFTLGIKNANLGYENMFSYVLSHLEVNESFQNFKETLNTDYSSIKEGNHYFIILKYNIFTN
jgi:hypothetical protein